MENFLRGSKTFNGITFDGCYNMPIDAFVKIYNHYLKTGDNLLDCYSKLIYMKWEMDNDEYMLNYDEYNVYSEYISSARRLKLFDSDTIIDLKYVLRNAGKNYKNHLDRIRNQPRRDACIFTSNIEIKDIVFDLHGRKCLACGSEKNI